MFLQCTNIIPKHFVQKYKLLFLQLTSLFLFHKHQIDGIDYIKETIFCHEGKNYFSIQTNEITHDIHCSNGHIDLVFVLQENHNTPKHHQPIVPISDISMIP